MLILYYILLTIFLTLSVVSVWGLCAITYRKAFKTFSKNKGYDIIDAIELLSEHYNVSEGYIINALMEGRELNENR